MIRFKYASYDKLAIHAQTSHSTKEDLVACYKLLELMRVLNLAEGFCEVVAGQYGGTERMIVLFNSAEFPEEHMVVLKEICYEWLSSHVTGVKSAPLDAAKLQSIEDIMAETW